MRQRLLQVYSSLHSSVVAIELTLIWNHAQGVYNISSTGQLIPFIVGLADLLKTLFSLFLIIWKKAGDL